MLRIHLSSFTFTRCCTVLAVVLGMALFGGNVPTAAAGVAGCRADPIVRLSDGTVLQITADIGTDIANITSISYVVHGPRTSTLLQAVSTPTRGVKDKESFQYVADAPANTYITETVIHTSVTNVAITATTRFANLPPNTSGTAAMQELSVAGFNGQVLRVTLRR